MSDVDRRSIASVNIDGADGQYRNRVHDQERGRTAQWGIRVALRTLLRKGRSANNPSHAD